MLHKSSPKRPYLLRAYYDWLVDNDFTPYLVVDATYVGVKVPVEYVKDGQIVLNLSANATGNLVLSHESIQFSARFRGVSQDIFIPMGAALAIYARENGDGVLFEPEAVYDEIATQDIGVEQPLSFVEAVDKPKASENTAKKLNKSKTAEKKATSHLRIIK